MNTKNYEDAKNYFINNATNGWKYIDCFIMNETLYKELKLDRSISFGHRIELAEGKRIQSTYGRLKSTIHGYGIILINSYTEGYSVNFLKYNNEIDERLLQLLNHNISKDYPED
jgi:hypothetical protein